MSAHYRFETAWLVPAPPEPCWQQVVDLFDPHTASWWRAVTITRPPESIDEGQALGLRVRSPLGYGLRLNLRITDARPPHLLIARSDGDLAGTGILQIRDAEGGSCIRLIWDVELRRRWMVLASPVLRGPFSWAHDRMMMRGERALRARLARV